MPSNKRTRPSEPEATIRALERAADRFKKVPPVPALLSVVARALRAGEEGGPPILLLQEACSGDATVILNAAARLFHIRASETVDSRDIAVAKTLRALVRARESGDETALSKMVPSLDLEDDWFSTANSSRRGLELEWIRHGVAAALGRYVRDALASPDRADSKLEGEHGHRIAAAFLDAALADRNRIILAEAGIPAAPSRDSKIIALAERYRKLLFTLDLERDDPPKPKDDSSAAREDPEYKSRVGEWEARVAEYSTRVAGDHVGAFVRAGYRALGMNKEQARGLFKFLEARAERGSTKPGVGQIDGILLRQNEVLVEGVVRLREGEDPARWTLDTIPPRASNFGRYLELLDQRNARMSLLQVLGGRLEQIAARALAGLE